MQRVSLHEAVSVMAAVSDESAHHLGPRTLIVDVNSRSVEVLLVRQRMALLRLTIRLLLGLMLEEARVEERSAVSSPRVVGLYCHLAQLREHPWTRMRLE